MFCYPVCLWLQLFWGYLIALPKDIDSAIGHAFDRRLEEFKLRLDSALELYKDDLSRSSAARSLILDREAKYFDKVDEILAELIPLMHVMVDSVSDRRFDTRDKECLLRYLEPIPTLKNVMLVYHPYIDEHVWGFVNELALCLQDDMVGWHDVSQRLSSGTAAEYDVEWTKNTRDEMLHVIAETRFFQARYLKGIASLDSK